MSRWCGTDGLGKTRSETSARRGGAASGRGLGAASTADSDSMVIASRRTPFIRAPTFWDPYGHTVVSGMKRTGRDRTIARSRILDDANLEYDQTINVNRSWWLFVCFCGSPSVVGDKLPLHRASQAVWANRKASGSRT